MAVVLDHPFSTARPIDDSFATILDLDRVVPCVEGATVLGVVQGRPSTESRRTSYRDGLLTCVPIVVAMGIVLWLGVYLPKPLADLVQEAANMVDVHP